MKKFEILNNDECNRLILAAQCGDVDSQNKVIESVLSWIIKLARELWCPGSEIDDLVQVGIIGCINAINTFDVNKGYVFITWANPVIKNEIRKYLRQFRPDKRPEYLESIIFRGKDNDVTLGEHIEDHNSSRFTEQLEERELLQNVLIEISKLSDDRRIIIESYFGLNGKTRMNQPELSELLGISQGYVSRIISKCIDDIKNTICI